MKWKFLLACAILVLITLGGIIALSYTYALYSEMLEYLDTAKTSNSEGVQSLNDAHELWQKNQALITILTGNGHVDAISLGFARAFAFAGERDVPPEYLSAIVDIITCITHLREYDLPSVRSIL